MWRVCNRPSDPTLYIRAGDPAPLYFCRLPRLVYPRMRPILLALIVCLLQLTEGCAPLVSRVEAEARPVTYVAIGASDAAGVGARNPERDGWPVRLHERLPARSTLVNLGVPGSRLGQALEQQLPVAVGLQPDLVTVWLAVNDLTADVPLERYAADLDLLLASLDETGATVLVGNVPDLALLPAFRGVDARLLQARVDAWNAAIAQVVGRHGAILVDLRALSHEQAQHPEYVAADGFHPSSEGYGRLAELFWDALQAGAGPERAGG